MRLQSVPSGSLVCFLLVALSMSAKTQQIDTPAGNSFSDGESSKQVMGLATASGDKKLAALIVRGADLTKDEDKSRAVAAFFADRPHWDQCVALWKQARATPAPKRTNVNGDSIKVGKYWDEAYEVLLTVGVDDDGTIVFAVVGPDKWARSFELQPKDFDDFGRDVSIVSTYFGQ
jgi:hypothetical protein